LVCITEQIVRFGNLRNQLQHRVPIIIAIAQRYHWDLVGFCLPMGFMINQVYVLYFNSKPANISYLTDQYSTGDSFKYGIIQLILIWIILILWTHYVMPLMGFNSRLW